MKKALIISLFISLSLKAFSQVSTTDSISFDQAIDYLEENSPYHFFYSPEWSKGVYFYDFPENMAPTSAIRWIAKQSNLNYSIVDEVNVVFLKDYVLKTNYAQTYLNYLNQKEAFVRDTVVYEAPKKQIDEEVEISKEYQLFKIGSPSGNIGVKTATLSGKISDIETGEPLIGTVIYIEDLKNGTVSNMYGHYSFTLPKGRYKIEFRSIGMKTTYRNIVIYSDGNLDVEMREETTSLKEVTITARSEDPVRNLRMGMEKISMKTLKQLPLGMGEPDIIKSTLLLPGVQSVGEASSGFNVRGGSTDQNLILLNEAPIVNTSHFFGFFSGFNSDMVKDITLYKSGIPAKYGGRVSSVMDLTLKEGNRKTYKVNGGISPVSGRLIAEGPLKKDKGSFILGARTTYSDWVLKLLDDSKLSNSKANFHDLQGNFSYDIDDKNSIYLSGYYSYDNFDYYTEDAFEYSTMASTLKWKHVFSPKLFSTTSAMVSNYEYTVDSRTDSTQLHSVEYSLNQYGFKSDFSYRSSQNHKIDFGLNTIWYELSPGTRTPIGDESLIAPKTIEDEQALEAALYVSDEFDLTHFMSISAGLRWSFYSNFGPKSQFNYQNGLPRTEESITDTSHYASGKSISFYSGPEFRFSSNIRLSSTSSMKIGFNRMYQYIQMISNTAAMAPTDIWKLSDNYLKPQRGDQYSIGYYKKLRNNTIEASVETYYKSLKNIIDYKGGAQLTMNEHLETDVLNGVGKAYGVEVMFQKKTGKLTGWVNYTYSRVLHKIDGNFQEEKVNNGDYFSANYDKPHDFKFVTNYKFSRRFNVSTNFFYSTGRPFTAPVAYYDLAGAQRIYYSDRNSIRMPDYIRLDVAATVNGNLVAKKLNHSSWTFAVYNIMGRQNAYNVFFRTEGEEVKGYKMSIFGQPIFTVTYNFKLFGNAKDDF
ncbi:TonB-dependent receptor [Carboxylicivirga linearis]|uniref:TonB-dependent receptor n=1 Tax=Carboxylicivirga linearis TaxID=1628157 RepID=A0ABS5JV00_9BACT|nr:TonB-dependent receptor [Carboxylicivirga linearis]MBS2098674.1 TonB-dependent receptor [Carboxylicivirga linearis]